MNDWLKLLWHIEKATEGRLMRLTLLQGDKQAVTNWIGDDPENQEDMISPLMETKSSF